LVENATTQPISRRGEKSFALLIPFALFFHASGMNRLVGLRHAGFFLCGDVFLQIVARLRHAAFCQDRWLFRCGIGIGAKDFLPLQEMPNNHQYPLFLSGRQV